MAFSLVIASGLVGSAVFSSAVGPVAQRYGFRMAMGLGLVPMGLLGVGFVTLRVWKGLFR